MADFKSYALEDALASNAQPKRSTDESIVMKIRYLGGTATGTVEVESGGDMLFVHGAGADTTIKIGSTNGTIDVSNAAGNTVKEVVDHINASPNWEAVMVDSLPTDVSTDTFLVLSAASADSDDGLDINSDSSVPLYISKSVQNSDLPSKNKKDRVYQQKIFEVLTNNTFASGTSVVTIYETDDVTATAVWSQNGAATTVDQLKAFGVNSPLTTYAKRFVVRIAGQTHAVGFVEVQGKSVRVEPVGE